MGLEDRTLWTFIGSPGVGADSTACNIDLEMIRIRVTFLLSLEGCDTDMGLPVSAFCFLTLIFPV